jgi:hypothetical protein
MISTTIIVAALLLLVSPKKMQQIVIAALIAFAFPQQAGIAVIIAGTAYMLHYLFIQKK